MATITAAIAAATAALVLVIMPIPEIALPPKFSGERDQVIGFINTCHLFI